jgi:hypothetical protein
MTQHAVNGNCSTFHSFYICLPNTLLYCNSILPEFFRMSNFRAFAHCQIKFRNTKQWINCRAVGRVCDWWWNELGICMCRKIKYTTAHVRTPLFISSLQHIETASLPKRTVVLSTHNRQVHKSINPTGSIMRILVSGNLSLDLRTGFVGHNASNRCLVGRVRGVCMCRRRWYIDTREWKNAYSTSRCTVVRDIRISRFGVQWPKRKQHSQRHYSFKSLGTHLLLA